MPGRQSGDSGRILWGVYFNGYTELLCRKVSLIKPLAGDFYNHICIKSIFGINRKNIKINIVFKVKP